MYINPYNDVQKTEGQWLKANFHTHAGTGHGTCGAYEIDDVVSLYKEAGYQVLTISNHDYYSDTREYAAKYGMIMMNSFEYSDNPHMLCIDIKDAFKGSHQEAIHTCAGQGGFVILCHPHWITKEYWPLKELDTLSGYTGIEIFNGVIFRLTGSGLATDTWDHLLSQGKLVWGFANDDFHRWYDLARSYNVIYAPSHPESANVKASILNGCFYASTGLLLNEMTFHDNILRISANKKNTHVKNNQYLFIGKDGQILKSQMGEYGEYHLSGDELYVRVQVISEHGAMLWTQPIYRKDSFSKP